MLLSIDTTSMPGSLALLDDAGVCTCVPGDGRPHGEALPASAVALLAAQGCALADVDVFAVATGPGSLTGLRVGMATVQGFAFATGRPCVGVSVFDALAWAWVAGPAAPAPGDAFGVWLDARRDEVFTRLVRRTAVTLDECAALGDLVTDVDGPAVGKAPERVEHWARLLAAPTRLWVSGSRATADAPVLAGLAVPLAFLAAPAALAGAIAAVAAREAAQGRTIAPHALHPLYVRRPDAEVARDRARAARPL